jgi:single-stranded-DNA-specific exonuclease
VTLKRDRIDELRRRLNQHAATHLTAEDLQPCVNIDAELPTEGISFELVAQLKDLEPYGAGNPRPTFLARNLCIVAEPRLIGERHLKMHVRGPQGRALETIWWNGAEQPVALKNGVEMVYTVETSKWNGETFLQLSVQDVRELETGNREQGTVNSEPETGNAES